MTQPSAATTRPADELFSVVELEAGSRCNRACAYCPVSLDPRPPVPVTMPHAVFDTLLQQLADVEFAGRISYHFYNEPLLRTDLHRLASAVSFRLPGALQVLYTNGDLLTDAKFDRLRAAGIDYFIVTRHSGGDFPARPFQVVQRAHDLVLTNRGGAMSGLPAPTARHRREACFAPSEMLIVTVTGDVVLCYEDSRREHVLGNILDAHVADIWRSPAFTDLRRQLAAGHRSRYDICSRCTNVAHARRGRSLVEEPFLNGETGATTIRGLKQASAAARRNPALEACVTAVVGAAAVGPPGRLPGEENIVYRQDTADGAVVVRLTETGHRSPAELSAELSWLIHLADRGVPVSRPKAAAPTGPYQVAGASYLASVFAFIDGTPPAAAAVDERLLEQWGALLRHIHAASDGYRTASRRRWLDTANYEVARLELTSRERLAVEAVLATADRIAPARLAHGDLGLRNIIQTRSGLVAIDFDDACLAPAGYDVAAVLYDLAVDHAGRLRLGPRGLARALGRGYGLVPTARLRALFAALVAERAITARRLGGSRAAADRNLRRLLATGRLPAALEDMVGNDPC